MASKQIGSQTDPQFGWVTADRDTSTDFDPITKAKDLYKTMYGVDTLYQGTKVPEMNNLIYRYAPQITALTGAQSPQVNEYGSYNKLLQWYYAATNPDVQNDPNAKRLLDYYAQALSSKNVLDPQMAKIHKAAAGISSPRGGPSPFTKATNPTYGKIATNLGVPTPFGTIVTKDWDVFNNKELYDLSGTPFTEMTPDQIGQALSKIAAAGMMSPNEVQDIYSRQGVSYPTNASERIQPLTTRSPDFEGYSNYLARQGGVPYEGPLDVGGPNIKIGVDLLSRYDPNMYGAPTLKRYFEGPNANITSYEGGPWTAKNDAQNYSWTKGGEFLVDEAFNYYKSKSTPGTLGSQWSPVAGNQYVQQGFFNNQPSFFTPYEYAVKGYADPTTMKTNIANIDPNIWAQQGNLQNLNGNWGFVTQNNPFMGLSNPNLQLDPETVTAKLKWDSGGGILGGLLGSLPGLIAGAFIPGSSFVTGAASLSSMFDKPTGSSRNPGPWYQPVVYPRWA